jgi:hypothetical protein
VTRRCGIRGEINIFGSEGAARDGRPYSAQGRAESLGHGKATIVFTVFRGDDHSVSVYTDAIGTKSKSFEFRPQNVEVDQPAGRN